VYRIKLSQCCVGEEEAGAVADVLRDGYLGCGEYVFAFERALESFFCDNVKVACVSSGTAAIQLALQAIGVKSGDKILVPSITYVASFQAVSAIGATPVACDVDISTGCMNLEDTCRKIDERVKAILYVHYAGGFGDRERMLNLAQNEGVRLIEDAAHSFGSLCNEKLIEERSDVLCFSFDGIKNITCGDGGCIVSNDNDVIDKVRIYRRLGIKETRDVITGECDFEIKDQGWRYHMNNLNAAIGIEQLKKINCFRDKRRRLASIYCSELNSSVVKLLDMDIKQTMPHIFPVLVADGKRNSLREFLFGQGIETGLHYKPNHLLSKFAGDKCPNAEEFGKRVISLPLHVSLSDQSVTEVCWLVNRFLMEGY
jgi:dTDP-4-amino-4,6-dideoxygalactose transaminase